MEGILVVDAAAKLGPGARGAVAACGSHGALYPAWLAARSGVRAIVFNDAGIGRHSAGIAGVAWLSGLGIAACAVDYRSARIGDGADTAASGMVSTVNDVAAEAGCRPGQPCRQALRCLLDEAPPPARLEIPEIGETRMRIANSGHREVWALDSIGLCRPQDRRAVIVTGSHGALLGGSGDDGMPAADVFAAFFNDAGGGKDDAGVARLPVLDARGVAAAAVSCDTARIGDGRSTYDTGVITRLNETARRLELKKGMSARQAVARLVGLG